MNAADLPLPEVPLAPQSADEPRPALASDGVQRHVWQSAFGAMLIEVAGDGVWMNGQRVVPIAEVQQDPEQEVDRWWRTHIMR